MLINSSKSYLKKTINKIFADNNGDNVTARNNFDLKSMAIISFSISTYLITHLSYLKLIEMI